MRITVDQSKCVGHGRCYAIAADLFRADDFGQGHPIREQLDDGLADAAETAAANCPESAITVSLTR